MLTVIVSVCSSATSVRPFQAVPFEICPEFLFADLERLVGLRSLADLDGIVLRCGCPSQSSGMSRRRRSG